jgi:hypothetical protein
MKRTLILAAIAALVLPAGAFAKGPSKASITGPNGRTVEFSANGEEPGTPAGDLAQFAGFFPAVFGQEPDPMLRGRPKGVLGHKFTVTYVVPGPDGQADRIRQDLYPYAKSGPVTYMAPGQKIFDTTTRGGWFPAFPRLRETLAAAGLKTAPAASSSNASFFSSGQLGLLAGLVLVLAGGTMIVLRRRRLED